MAGDAPLLERLAGMTPVAAAEVLELIERLSEPQSDPVIGPLFGMDDEGEAVVNPLVPAVLQQFQDKRSEEHTSELQSPDHLLCRLLLEKKKASISMPAGTHETPQPSS